MTIMWYSITNENFDDHLGLFKNNLGIRIIFIKLPNELKVVQIINVKKMF